MGLVYLPMFDWSLSMIYVGKHTGPMDPMGNDLNHFTEYFPSMFFQFSELLMASHLRIPVWFLWLSTHQNDSN